MRSSHKSRSFRFSTENICSVEILRSTHCVGRDGLEPVVVQVEQHHLRLRGLQDEVSELLDLQTGLEGQLQLRAFDHDVGEVKQVDLHENNIR